MLVSHQATTEKFAELSERNRVQDQEMEKLAQQLGGRDQGYQERAMVRAQMGRRAVIRHDLIRGAKATRTVLEYVRIALVLLTCAVVVFACAAVVWKNLPQAWYLLSALEAAKDRPTLRF